LLQPDGGGSNPNGNIPLVERSDAAGAARVEYAFWRAQASPTNARFVGRISKIFCRSLSTSREIEAALDQVLTSSRVQISTDTGDFKIRDMPTG
jgi:hypothetical protein